MSKIPKKYSFNEDIAGAWGYDLEMWREFEDYDRGRDPDLLIIEDNEINIEIDYPLRETFYFKVKSKNGFTRKKVFEVISNIYKNKIYKYKKYRQLLWGHGIEDLALEYIEYNKNKKLLKLGIGS